MNIIFKIKYFQKKDKIQKKQRSQNIYYDSQIKYLIYFIFLFINYKN